MPHFWIRYWHDLANSAIVKDLMGQIKLIDLALQKNKMKMIFSFISPALGLSPWDQSHSVDGSYWSLHTWPRSDLKQFCPWCDHLHPSKSTTKVKLLITRGPSQIWSHQGRLTTSPQTLCSASYEPIISDLFSYPLPVFYFATKVRIIALQKYSLPLRSPPQAKVDVQVSILYSTPKQMI